MSTKLSLRIHSVKCIDETGGKYAEKFGNDEIYLGGFSVNEKGETVKISPVSIYADFDDGDIKKFNPPKVFKTFPLPSGGKNMGFAVGLVLIERDAGGMVSAVEKITTKAAELLKAKLKEAQTVRAQSPAAAAVLTPLIIEALKLAAPYIIDYAKKFIVSAFSDEIFTPQFANVTIKDTSFTWAGHKDSAEKKVIFRDHSGIYELTYDWLLS